VILTQLAIGLVMLLDFSVSALNMKTAGMTLMVIVLIQR
jgi:hypothetical protein